MNDIVNKDSTNEKFTEHHLSPFFHPAISHNGW